jgi:hypothetical protein
VRKLSNEHAYENGQKRKAEDEKAYDEHMQWCTDMKNKELFLII